MSEKKPGNMEILVEVLSFILNFQFIRMDGGLGTDRMN